MPKLGELAEIRAGASIRGKLPVDPDGNALAIQQGDISVAGISETLARISYPKFDRYQLKDGDVLLRSKGTPMVAAEFKERLNVPLPTIAAASVLILHPKEMLIRPRYLAWLLNSPWMQDVFSSIKSGTHIPVLAVRDLVNAELPLPSLEEQEKICALSELAMRHEELASEYRQKIDMFLVARSFDARNRVSQGGL